MKTGELHGSPPPINVPPLPDRNTMLKKQSQLVNMKKVKVKGNGGSIGSGGADAITQWPT